MHRQTADLDTLLRPVITDMGYVCWGIEYLRQGRSSLLRVYIDKETGVTLEDCEQVSRRVSGILDVEDPISGGYRLEVSSPGLERPLFSPEQYQQFIGKRVTVRLQGGLEQRKRITGRIREADGEAVLLDEAGSEYRIPLAAIIKAELCPGEIGRNDKH